MAYNPKTITVSQGGTGSVSLTAHNLIVGNGTSVPNLLAPSATSGVPIISQGASADPVYGTAVVAGGGTGVTSNTAYAVLCGGTTSTGAIQSIAGVGTAGQVLMSNGAGALPTFQNSLSSVGFSAYKSANSTNITGDGTNYTLIANTKLRDIGTNYNSATGVFTAPQTGIYLFTYSFGLGNVQQNHNAMSSWIFSNATIGYAGRISQNLYTIVDNAVYFFSGSAILYMTSGQTAQAQIQVGGGSKVITIQGEATYLSSFSGFLIG